jgi:DNA-binding XRE family transcriptional regulator
MSKTTEAKPTEGIKKLKAILKNGTKPAEIAVALDCSTTTLYNILSGDGKPSLHVANAALRVYKIPTTAWEQDA